MPTLGARCAKQVIEQLLRRGRPDPCRRRALGRPPGRREGAGRLRARPRAAAGGAAPVAHGPARLRQHVVRVGAVRAARAAVQHRSWRRARASAWPASARASRRGRRCWRGRGRRRGRSVWNTKAAKGTNREKQQAARDSTGVVVPGPRRQRQPPLRSRAACCFSRLSSLSRL